MYSKIAKTVKTLARIHTDLNNVDITFHRGATYTNGNTININAGSPKDKVWLALVEGKATHESGHIRFTNFNALRLHMEELKKRPLLHPIWNIIEDVRMEMCVINAMSGTYWTFKKMGDLLFEEGYWDVPRIDDDSKKLLTDFLLFGGRGYGVVGQEHLLVHFEVAKAGLLNSGVDAKLLKRIENRMSKWAGLSSTEAAYKEALKILELIDKIIQGQSSNDSQKSGTDSQPTDGQSDGSGQSGQPQEQDEEQASNQNGQSNDSDSESDNEEQPSGQSDAVSDETSDDNLDDDSADGCTDASEEGDDSGDLKDRQSDSEVDNSGSDSGDSGDDSSSDQAEGSANAKSSSQSDSDSTGDCTNDDQQTESGTSGSTNPLMFETEQEIADAYVDMHELLDKALDQHATDNPASELEISAYQKIEQVDIHNSDTYNESEITKVSRPLSRSLESAMWGKSSKPVIYDDTGSDFDPNLLGGVMAGNNRIFHQDIKVNSQSSALVILVDSSGSMSGDSMLIANNAAAACALAMERVGMEVAILHYSNDVFQTKLFCDSMRSRMKKFAMRAGGGTRTHLALIAAAKVLAQSKAERKQVLLITDGEPNDVGMVRRASEAIHSDKIDLASIQVKLDKFAGVKNYEVIHDIKELPKLMTKMVRDNALSTITVSS